MSKRKVVRQIKITQFTDGTFHGSGYVSGGPMIVASNTDDPHVIVDELLYDTRIEDSRLGCDALLYHGPGHQSSTQCEVLGDHVVHETHYAGGMRARWRDGQHKEGEPHGITGFFDEPPDDESNANGDFDRDRAFVDLSERR